MSILRTQAIVKLRVYNRTQTVSRLIPLTSVTTVFSLNEIPQCQAQVGLGADIHNANVTPVDDAAMTLMEEGNPCQVLAIFTGDFTSDDRWNDEAQIIFEGRINNVANQVALGAATLNVSIRHWLADLQGQSLLMSYAYHSDPRTAQSLAVSYGALGQTASRTASGNPRASAIGTLADAQFMQSNRFQEDLWGKGLKELFVQLATNDLTRVTDGTACVDAVNRVQPKVIVALSRLQGPTSKLGLDYTPGVVPLQLRDAFGAPYHFSLLRSIAESIIGEPINAYYSSDIWTKLAGSFQQEFKTVVVPRVLDAAMVPYMPALRTPYCHRIVSSDIVQLGTLEPVRKPIRGFAIYAPSISQMQSRDAPPQGDQTVAGFVAPKLATACFAPDDVVSNGKIEFGESPPWLRGVLRGYSSIDSLIMGNRRKGGPGAPGQASVRPPVAILTGAEVLLQQFAQYGYYEQRLTGRSLKIVGKLRYDIAPGSTVEVIASLNQFTGVGRKAPAFQGMVTRVTTTIDVARRSALTILQLSHNRTLAENELDSFTTDQHPLYAQAFHGCPLHDAYENVPCPP